MLKHVNESPKGNARFVPLRERSGLWASQTWETIPLLRYLHICGSKRILILIQENSQTIRWDRTYSKVTNEICLNPLEYFKDQTRLALRVKTIYQPVRSTWWFRKATWRWSLRASSEDVFWWETPIQSSVQCKVINDENHLRATWGIGAKNILRAILSEEAQVTWKWRGREGKGGRESKTKNTFVIHSVSVDQIILFFYFFT